MGLDFLHYHKAILNFQFGAEFCGIKIPKLSLVYINVLELLLKSVRYKMFGSLIIGKGVVSPQAR